MKLKSYSEIDKSWWKKEQPEGLGKSAAPFEKAVDEFAKARDGLKEGDESTGAKLETAIDGLLKAAKDVVDELKALEKKEKDSKAKKAFKVATDTLGKQLQKEMVAVGEVIEEMMAGADDDDEEDDDEEAGDKNFGTQQAHTAYLKKRMPKLKKQPWNFAVGLPSNDPADMRMNFHKKKGGRTLGGQLKKAAGAKKFTFGVAGGLAYGESFGLQGLSGRTLVLNIKGKKIPGLAKRVKLFLRMMKISAFGKVVLLTNGVVAETVEEEDEDFALDPVDLDTPETDDDDVQEVEEDVPGGPTSSEEKRAQETTVSAPEIAAALKRRIGAAQPMLKEVPPAVAKKLAEVLKAAVGKLGERDFAAATKLVEAVEQQLAKLGKAPEETQSAPPPPPPPPAPSAEKIEKALTGLVKKIQGLPDKSLVAGLVGQAREIQSMLREGQLKDASAAIVELSKAVTEAASATPDTPTGESPLITWRTAKESVDEGLSALQNALRGVGHPDLDRIADYGLNGAADGNNTKLMAALMSYDRVGADGREAAAAAVLKELQAYRQFLTTSQLLSLCENNPFGVTVPVRDKLGTALDKIEETLAA